VHVLTLRVLAFEMQRRVVHTAESRLRINARRLQGRVERGMIECGGNPPSRRLRSKHVRTTVPDPETTGPHARRPTPEECLRRVALGDRDAFNHVYAAFAAPVFGLARRVLRDPAQAEEVAQEVLVEVWRTASRFDPQLGSAQAWVMTMAHRRADDRADR
jgi:hypothetical protein